MAMNYTLGRGRLYFARFAPGTQDPTGYQYFGNTPEVNLSIETENLDHFSAESGVREKDDSVALQTNRTGSFTTDHISERNLALFFFGDVSTLTTSSGTVTGEAVAGIVKGGFVQVGIGPANPVGVRGISAVTVTSDPAGTTYTAGTDYVVNADAGLIEILETGTIPDGADLLVDYTRVATTRTRVVSGDTPIEGSLLYVSDNPRGSNRDIVAPWVKITPNGDFALKGEDWQTIPFNLEILKKTGMEAIYIDGRPATP